MSYAKQNFTPGQLLKASQINHIEDGISFIYDSLSLSNQVTYTVKIDLSNSNPLTCCEYLDDAVGMIKGSANWDNKPIFNTIRPCVFKDGKVNYYLDPNNFNLKADGSASILTGETGDVMIEFGKFAYRIYKEDNNLYVSISNKLEDIVKDNRFHYYAFTRLSEGDLNNFYWGAFKGSLDNEGKLRSIINKTPDSNKTISTFSDCAKLNGEHYTISNYAQLVALQCLYIIKYGNLDSQSALGKGYTELSEDAGLTITGQTLDKGMYYGSTTDGAVQMKFAGIEDFWGNIWEWVKGLITDSSLNIITEMGGNIITPSDLIEGKSGFVSDVTGTTETGFMGTIHSGSSSTYFSDYGHLYADRVLLFGGHWNSGSDAGAFYLSAYCYAFDAYSSFGARLAYI